MIKGWRNNPAWVAHYKEKEALKQAKKDFIFRCERLIPKYDGARNMTEEERIRYQQGYQPEGWKSAIKHTWSLL